MNCLICNELLGGTRAIWGTTAENECHLECTDALLAFLFRMRSEGNSQVKGIIEVLLSGTRLAMLRERMARA